MRGIRVALALGVLASLVGQGPGAQVVGPGGNPGSGGTTYPQPTAGWDTAVNHVGDSAYFMPAYPIAFVLSPVVETTSVMCRHDSACYSYDYSYACENNNGTPGTVYPSATRGDYHVGADVLSANDPSVGNELWIYLPATGQVKKLFPRDSHESSGLIDFAKENGSVVEPNLSEDGTRIYFSYFQDATEPHGTPMDNNVSLPLSGADLYAIDISPLLTNPLASLDSLQVTRLTQRVYDPFTAWKQLASDRYQAAMNPTLVAPNPALPKAEYGTVFMHGTEVRTAAGLQLAYVSDQRRLANSNQRMEPANHNFNLHMRPVLPDGTLGTENNQLQYYTTTSAFSPTPLREGLAFSYQASTEDGRLWHIQGLDSEGRWYPIIGYGANPELFHLASFCVSENNGLYEDYLVATKYYNASNEGFGSLWKQKLEPSVLGKNRYDVWYGGLKVPRQEGSTEITDPPGGSTLAQDYPSPSSGPGQYYGKFTAPRCGGVDQLYFSYTPTSANGRLYDNECNRDKYRSHIGYRPNLDPFVPGPWSSGQGSKIVIKKTANDANLLWAVPIVGWGTRSHGDSVQRVSSVPVVSPGTDILPGEPFARVGTVSLWNTDRRPFECYLPQPRSNGQPNYYSPWGADNVNQENDLVTWNQDGWTWVTTPQGSPHDFCQLPSPCQILGLAINITSNKANHADSSFGYTTDGMIGRGVEASRLLGIYDVRQHGDPTAPCDPSNLQPDQSVFALIPAHVPVEFQALDREYGMKLTDVRSWHSLKPRETRTNCGGCHQHDRNAAPVPYTFESTYAGTHPALDLVRSTTYLTYNDHCQVETTPSMVALPAVDYPEWRSDIWPSMNGYCGSCHNSTTGNGTGNAALSWPDATQASGDAVYNQIGFRRFASALRGALGSQLFWAARGERTDGRANTAHPADYDCPEGSGPGQCSQKQKWGFYYSSIHSTLGLPGGHPCTTGDLNYARWVFRLGKWIDNHMPRNTGNQYGYKFDWYHPTADSALSTGNCATTQIRVGWWDDSNKLKSILVKLDDATTLYQQQWPSASQPIANGSALVSLPTVSSSDWITVEVRDHQDNRQVYRKKIEQLQAECSPGP